MMKFWRKALTLCLPLFFLACDGTVSSIPERDVYLRRYIDNYQLSVVGKYIYITTRVNAEDRLGFGGLLVIHALNGEYYAVDLACPKELDEDTRVGLPNDLCICKCPVCGEEYDMGSGQGNPTKGIAKETLKHYSVYQDDYGYIVVTR
jgi:hypothetical protein